MCSFGHCTSVVVCRHRTCIACFALGVGQVHRVVVDGQHQLVCHQLFRKETKRHGICHLLQNNLRLGPFVGLLQHLSAAEGVRLRTVGLDIIDGTRLPPPGMIDEQLSTHAKQAVEEVFVLQGLPCNLPHGGDAILRQLRSNAPPYSPEGCQRTMVPERATVAHLIKLCNANAILVCLHVLGHNIHSHLGQIHVCADACCGSDACSGQHIANHPDGQFMRCHLIDSKIGCHIDEDFIDAIDMNIL